ncbi:MAG: DinB family protein [Bacteroidetes bacterium]|nr:MAG: DinB family protein [Bacteroidota bacterium]
MKKTVFLLVAMLGLAGWARAQEATAPGNPVIQSLKAVHDIPVAHLMATAEMLDDALYAYRPTEEVRTAGQILAHVADAQFFFCSAARGEANPNDRNFEESALTKEEIIEALKAGFAYCDAVYAQMTDAEGARMRPLMGQEMAASAILAFNTAHNYEHYGNLVTYLRMNRIVPPSSR